MKKMVIVDMEVLDQEKFNKLGISKEEILGQVYDQSNSTREGWGNNQDDTFKVKFEDQTDKEWINIPREYKVVLEADDFKTRVEIFPTEYEATTRCDWFLDQFDIDRHPRASFDARQLDLSKEEKINGWMVLEE